MKNEISVDFEIGFADSNVQCYTFKDNNVIFLLECWNSAILEITFSNFILLNMTNDFRISDLQEAFESPLLNKALKKLYEKIPKEHNLKVFKLIDSNGETALEIVCENINIKKIKS